MTIANADTTLLEVNPACRALFGYPTEALVGTKFLSHVPDEYRADVIRDLEAATPENPSFTILQEQELNGESKILLWSNQT